MQYSVLLYYQFTRVADPQAFRDEHYRKCLELGLKGRILVAAEGLNGTVSGPVSATEAYKAYVRSLPGFAEIQWKEDPCEFVPFAKLKVKLRKSLVSLGDEDHVSADTNAPRGKYLEPAEWKRVLAEEKDYVLLDVRNRYEGEVGKFRGRHQDAVVPPFENFYDFPEWMKDLRPLKDKKILMYCTGGIRCEKFSALLVQEGFGDVNQLHGGILEYAKQEAGEFFEGSCFVFDDRLTVPVNKKSAPIAACRFCAVPEDRVLNCANMVCNELFVCCDACAESRKGCCSPECEASEARRPFDRGTFRIPFRKKGVVFPELGLAKNQKKSKNREA